MSINSESIEIPEIILSIWDFEFLCREFLKLAPAKSSLEIQLIIELSTLGYEYSSLIEAYRNLRAKITNSGNLMRTASELGYVDFEARDAPGQSGNRYRIFAKIKQHIRIVDSDNIDFQSMLKIREALNIYGRSHTKATPYAGLILSGIYVRKINSLPEMTRFLGLDKKPGGPSTAYKIINRFRELGILATMSINGEKGTQNVVYPVL